MNLALDLNGFSSFELILEVFYLLVCFALINVLVACKSVLQQSIAKQSFFHFLLNSVCFKKQGCSFKMANPAFIIFLYSLFLVNGLHAL